MMSEFKINDFITLRLENNHTNIYIKGQLFNQCKTLILNIPVENLDDFETIESIDDVEEKLSKNKYQAQEVSIPPETEFWGHCSNLQTWAELDYDTRILHRNISFPLLKRLVDAGDPKAKRVFKDEIAYRFLSNNELVQIYLLKAGLLEYLTKEEIGNLIQKFFSCNNRKAQVHLIREGYLKYLNVGDIQNYIRITILIDNHEVQISLIHKGYLKYLTKEERTNLIQKVFSCNNRKIQVQLIEKGYLKYLKAEDIQNYIRTAFSSNNWREQHSILNYRYLKTLTKKETYWLIYMIFKYYNPSSIGLRLPAYLKYIKKRKINRLIRSNFSYDNQQGKIYLMKDGLIDYLTRRELIGLILTSIPHNNREVNEYLMYKGFLKGLTIMELSRLFNLSSNTKILKSLIDFKKCQLLAKDPNIHKKIALSIAPNIHGGQDLKLACALSLFGGIRKIRAGGTYSRGDIHVLFVGGSKMEKTKILESAIELSPKGIYTSCKGPSVTCITAKVTRNDNTGQMNLEKGAIVLANGGVLAIDEIEGISNYDGSALHEGMAQQTISIAKMGIVKTLKSQTAIIATARIYTKDGKFDKSKSWRENIHIPPSLLGRFDWIFKIKDQCDSFHDNRITPIKGDFLKKYIKFARRVYHPRISDEVIEELKEFYLEKRAQDDRINLKGLSILIPMIEAYARMALRDVATREDAKQVIRLFKIYLGLFGI